MANNFMNNYPYNTMNTMPMTGVPAYGQIGYQQQMQMPRGGSGTYPMGNGPWYYDDGMSGRRYYDGEKEDAIHKLHKAMDAETNPEFRMAIQEAIHMLEGK